MSTWSEIQILIKTLILYPSPKSFVLDQTRNCDSIFFSFSIEREKNERLEETKFHKRKWKESDLVNQ